MHQFSFAKIQYKIFEIPDSISQVRSWSLGVTSTIGTFSVLSVLSNQWYSDYQQVPFHFFNDNKEWLQMDKLGHGVAAFYGGYYGYNLLKWAGVKEHKSIYYGGTYGFVFLLATEIMDGFSPEWGASGGDLLANGLGTVTFITQQLCFKKQIFTPKFSYLPSKYAAYRPSLLGNNHWNRWLKDYNGQVYWLSFSLFDMNVKSRIFPKWLSFAVGYGADGMIGGSSNPLSNEQGDVLPVFNRQREIYLSLDLNFQNIKTKYAFLNSFLKGISFLKFPFPALIFTKDRLRLIPIH